jgi:uncharacterized SAM-binding protein YcdF (DUF218 family)
MTEFISSLLQPHIFLYLLMVGALISLWRTRPALPRRRLLWLTVPFVLLSLLSVPALGYLGFGSLEWSYPPLRQRPAEAEVIVVLSGYLKAPDEVLAEAELGEDTLYRCLRAAELYQQGPRCPILVSGGKVDPSQPGPTLAAAMRDFLVKLGVAAEDILLEDRSRSTYENALYSSEILRRRGLAQVVLVTDANHLLRAELCFRKQGIAVVPCGCYYHATHFDAALSDFLPNPASFGQHELVLHEWMGLAWYWLCSRI